MTLASFVAVAAFALLLNAGIAGAWGSSPSPVPREGACQQPAAPGQPPPPTPRHGCPVPGVAGRDDRAYGAQPAAPGRAWAAPADRGRPGQSRPDAQPPRVAAPGQAAPVTATSPRAADRRPASNNGEYGASAPGRDWSGPSRLDVRHRGGPSQRWPAASDGALPSRDGHLLAPLVRLVGLLEVCICSAAAIKRERLKWQPSDDKHPFSSLCVLYVWLVSLILGSIFLLVPELVLEQSIAGFVALILSLRWFFALAFHFMYAGPAPEQHRVLGNLMQRLLLLLLGLIYFPVIGYHSPFRSVDPSHHASVVTPTDLFCDKKRGTVFVVFLLLKAVVFVLFMAKRREEQYERGERQEKEPAPLSGKDWFVFGVAYVLWPGFRPELLFPGCGPEPGGAVTAANDDVLDATTKEDLLFAMIFIVTGGLGCTYIHSTCRIDNSTDCQYGWTTQIQAVMALVVFCYLGSLRLAHAVGRLCGYNGIQVPYRSPHLSMTLSEFWGFEKAFEQDYPSARGCVFLGDMHRAVVCRPLESYFNNAHDPQGYFDFCWIFGSFFLIGLLLEASLSAPVWRGGGRPMLYALSQALFVFVEKSEWPSVARYNKIWCNLRETSPSQPASSSPRPLRPRVVVFLFWFLPLAVCVISLEGFCREIAWPWSLWVGGGAHALISVFDNV